MTMTRVGLYVYLLVSTMLGAVVVTAQDTIVLLNGQRLPCEIIIQNLQQYKVRFSEAKLIEIYSKTHWFDEHVVSSIRDFGAQRKIKLGQVSIDHKDTRGRTNYKFYSIDKYAITVVRNEYRDSLKNRQYTLEKIPATTIAKVKWKNQKTAIGAVSGAAGGALTGLLLMETNDFGDPGDRITGSIVFAAMGAVIGTGIGAIVTDRATIDHGGDLAEWQLQYERIPKRKQSGKHN